MTAVCPDSLTAIMSPFPKHLNTAAAAAAAASARAGRRKQTRSQTKWLQGVGEVD